MADLDDVDAFLKELDQQQQLEGADLPKLTEPTTATSGTDFDAEVEKLLFGSGTKLESVGVGGGGGVDSAVVPDKSEYATPRPGSAIPDAPSIVDEPQQVMQQQSKKLSPEEVALNKMVAMGYAVDEAKEALAKTGFQVDPAVELIESARVKKIPSVPTEPVVQQSELVVSSNKSSKSLLQQPTKAVMVPAEVTPKEALQSPPLPERRPSLDSRFSAFKTNAGSFFKKLADNTAKALENTHLPGGREPRPTIPIDTSLSPTSEGLLGALQLGADAVIPDVFKDPKAVVDEFRQRVLNMPELSAKDLLLTYRRDCQGRNAQPVKKVLQQLMAADQAGKPVQVLDLTDVALDVLQIKSLANLLVLTTGLKRLSLEATRLTDETLLILLKGLLLIDRLPWLNLSYNTNLGPNGAKLAALYLKKTRALKFLDLSHCTLDIASASTLARTASSESCLLQVLKLDHCALNGAVLEEFANQFKHSRVKALSLRGNRIKTDSVAAIASLIAYNSALVRFDVGVNEIGSGGVGVILTTIQRPESRLKELYIADNQLGSVACYQLGDFLRTNSYLEFLDVSLNRQLFSVIDDVIHFKDGLAQNRALKTLILEQVGLKADSAITIAEALAENSTLKHVSLMHNDAALNPLRANMVNMGQNVLAFGQKALKAVSGAAEAVNESIKNRQKQKSQESLGTANLSAPGTADAGVPSQKSPATTTTTGSSILNVAIPTATELAVSALMALVISMKHNRSITSMEVIPADELREAQTRRGTPMVDQVLDLIEELNTICRKNAPTILASQVAPDAESVPKSQQPPQPELSVASVKLELETARRTICLLQDMLAKMDNTSDGEKETTKQLRDQCAQLRSTLASYSEKEVVAKDEVLLNQVVTTCTDLSAVIKSFEEASNQAQALKQQQKEEDDSQARNAKAFVLEDDDDE